MKGVIKVLFAGGLILFCCCRQSRDIRMSELPGLLVVGQGGGFTGMRTEYYLAEDGNVWHHDTRTDSVEWLVRNKKKFGKRAFSDFYALGLDTMALNMPSNFYYYIAHYTPADTQRVVWGDQPFPNREAITSYYHRLYTAAQQPAK